MPRVLFTYFRAGAENETTAGKIAHPGCSLRGATAYDFLVKARIPGPKRDYLLTAPEPMNVLTTPSARKNIINGLSLASTLPRRVEISHREQG